MPSNAPPPEQPPGPDHTHWVTVALLIFGVYYLMQVFIAQPANTISYSDFLQRVDDGKVSQVMIKGHTIYGSLSESADSATASTTKRQADFQVVIPEFENASLLQRLQQQTVEIAVEPGELPFWARLLAGFLPWILILAFFFWSSRALQSKLGGGLGGFGRSRARPAEMTDDGPGYNDIAGLESAKQDFQEVIDYLRDPEKFRQLDAHIPRGILMMGAPGTGKTLLARATAHEAGVPFFSVSGSEFIEMYVGVGASRVRDLFQKARSMAPALIFIDEIDSVGRVRGTGLGGGNDEREQTLNQILAEMDGFEAHESVLVLAATNRPDVLDPALMRPGRFDRKITLDLPQRQARFDILTVHCRKKPLDNAIDLAEIATLTPGFSGADLANLVNEAALNAARNSRDHITQTDLLSARDKIIMGSERPDLLNPSERRRIACHEAGHALTAHFLPHTDPVQKISIVPHGRALGLTEQLPTEDRHNLNQDFLMDNLAVLLGGRVAEQLLFGSVSSGAADDLQRATQLAYRMVGQWGMGNKLGPVGYRIQEQHPFLGKELSSPREFSESTATLMDEEVRQLLQHSEQRAQQLLQQQRSQLDALVESLLQQETLSQRDLQQILGRPADVIEPG